MKMVTEKQESMFILLDDLARAMQAEDTDSYPEWEQLADEIETALNNYIKDAKTVSVNGVNLFDVRRVDAYEFKSDDKSDDNCSVGLLFRDSDSKDVAVIVVDAAKVNLRLRVSWGLFSIETVDKLGRRF